MGTRLGGLQWSLCEGAGCRASRLRRRRRDRAIEHTANRVSAKGRRARGGRAGGWRLSGTPFVHPGEVGTAGGAGKAALTRNSGGAGIRTLHRLGRGLSDQCKLGEALLLDRYLRSHAGCHLGLDHRFDGRVSCTVLCCFAVHCFLVWIVKIYARFTIQ